MTAVGIEEFCAIENENREQVFGLVSPYEVNRFVVSFESEEQLDTATAGFDELYRLTDDYGRIRFHGRTLFMNRYPQSGNLIRGFSIPTPREHTDSELRTEMSLNELHDGLMIGEIHHSLHVINRGVIIEPPVGSPDVKPFKNVNLNDFVRLVEESKQRIVDQEFWRLVGQEAIN